MSETKPKEYSIALTEFLVDLILYQDGSVLTNCLTCFLIVSCSSESNSANGLPKIFIEKSSVLILI